MTATTTKPKKVYAPVKTYGGKYYTADWIISHLPPRDTYLTFIDAMVMSGAVMLAHDGLGAPNAKGEFKDGKNEIVNDKNGLVTNFWRVMQDEDLFCKFHRRLQGFLFNQNEFDASLARAKTVATSGNYLGPGGTPNIGLALDFFVIARTSRAGDMLSFTNPTINRLRRNREEHVSAWMTSVDRLPEVAARCKRWFVMCEDAFDLIKDKKYNFPKVVQYYDPPYLREGVNGRASKEAYGVFDWTPEKHRQFLELAVKSKAKILISGYDTQLYNEILVRDHGWRVDRLEQALHTSGAKEKRRQTECLFMNYDPPPQPATPPAGEDHDEQPAESGSAGSDV